MPLVKALLFLLFPILEFYLLVRVGTEVGALNVVLWCIATAVLGGWVVKDHGVSVLQRMQSQLLQGIQPQDSMLSAVLVFFAGVMLILPGFITDALGLLLLIPPVRQAVSVALARQAAQQQQSGASRVFFFRTGMPGMQNRRGPFREEPNLRNPEAPRQVTVIDCTPGDAGGVDDQGVDDAESRETGPRGDEEEVIFDCEPSPQDDVSYECSPADEKSGGNSPAEGEGGRISGNSGKAGPDSSTH